MCHVCVFVFVCVYIHTCISLCVSMSQPSHNAAYLFVSFGTCHMRVRACVYICMYAYVYVYVYVCMYVPIHTDICLCVSMAQPSRNAAYFFESVGRCNRVCMRARARMRVYVCVCVCVYIYIYIYIYIHRYTYICSSLFVFFGT